MNIDTALVTSPEAIAAFQSETTSTTLPINSSVLTVTTPNSNSNIQALSTPGFSEEDIQRAREVEKQKLYPQIQSLKTEVDALRKDKDAREAAEAQILELQAQAIKAKEEEGLELRELLALREKEWNEKFESERRERELAIALVERERKYAELTEYRANRIEAERENIIPELVDLIGGNTQDEIEQSIAGLRDRSSRILESVSSATQNARREMSGTRTTFPADGPLDNNMGQKSFTVEEVAAMTQTEYKQHREKLLGMGAKTSGRGFFD